ncbi:ABC transporter substrate-binding protein [Methanolobus profundi]|uniref:Iron complex transport system substrate-binding protein n=1 Tax=Methanolobus profundi TaxID=487685 RepID=A0A1I4PHG3_9EURY|nr:ABC transporter substrate-binding protein [Methanolobus profundi]SFM27249.1 iron complex transport system substrate-binding protein [Methanolobus profundi]
MRLKLQYIAVLGLLLCILLSVGCTENVTDNSIVAEDATNEEQYRTVVDSRGVAVEVPVNIERVATVSDGLVEGVMTSIGVQDTLVGVGSSCLQRNFNYSYETVGGETYEYENGMNPVTYLNPWIMELPLFVSSGSAVNYETLASLEPDVVIVRIGSCSLRYIEDESTQKSIETMESLGVPIVVLYDPNCYDSPDMATISDEINIIGQVFGKEYETQIIADYLEEQVSFVSERTQTIQEEEKPEVLIFGASPKARGEGGAGQIFGLDTLESFFIEDIVNANNAFQEEGYFKTVSAEHMLALNPDVIVLCTASGYHPPLELYEAPYYQSLQEMDAIKNRKVVALPWSPCNCAKRLEYPIDVMVIATGTYPELFEDVELDEWLIEFYQNVYGVDVETAKELRSAQWMEWTIDECPSCS